MLSDEILDKPFTVDIHGCQGAIQCIYINNHRAVGGKPWGGQEIKSFEGITLRDVVRAFPELYRELGLNSMGNPVKKAG